MKKYFLIITIAIAINSCKTDSPVQSGADPNSSFGQLQTKVFNKTCTGCHTLGTDYALQSGLVLDAGVAYQNLVSIKAHYINAAADGLLRVKPGIADNSFLYMKLDSRNSRQAKEYGLHMPLGTHSLSAGQKKFIRDWIKCRRAAEWRCCRFCAAQ